MRTHTHEGLYIFSLPYFSFAVLVTRSGVGLLEYAFTRH